MGQATMNPAMSHEPQLVLENSTPHPTSSLSRRKCQVELLGGSAPHLTNEIESLLLRRLRLATSITVGAFVLLLIQSLFHPAEDVDARIGPFRAAQLVTALILALVCATLWSNSRLTLTWLRILEMTFFGVFAAYLAWTNHLWFFEGDISGAAAPGKESVVVRLVNSVISLRWFGLIVIYGVFIPNTW